MSISSRIESIAEHLEKDWNSIEAIGGEAEDKNIENIAGVLDPIYEELPKIEETGTEISLSPTRKGKMEIELSPSELEQETTSGKNLFDKDNIIEGKYIDASGGLVNDSSNFVGDYIAIDNTKSYYASQNTGGSIRIGYYDSSKIFISRQLIASNAGSLTIPNNAEYVRLSCYNTSLDTLQLEQGSTATEYEPYTGGQPSPNPDYPQDIHVVTGENSVKVENKNIFDDSVKNNTWISLDGTINTTSTGSNLMKIKCSAGDTYTLSGTFETASSFGALLIAFFDKNNNMLSRTATGNQTTITKTATAPNDTAYMYAGHYTNEPLTIQLVYGNATPYEEHKEQTYPISLGNLEYCKIGNYEDEFYKATESDTGLTAGKWYLKKNVGKTVVNNNATMSGVIERTTTSRTIINNLSLGGLSNSNLLFCNRLIGTTDIYSNDVQGCYINIDNLVISIDKSLCGTTQSSIQTYLGNNNLILYYPTTTPTYTLLNDTLQTQLDNIHKAITYQEQTNVSQTNADLPFVLNLSALLDWNTYIEHLEAQVEALS